MFTLPDLLKKHFGYENFRPQQLDIIENVLSGKDTFVLMPTGGGKSLCYQLPALKFEGATLVISPLIALMKDQVDALVSNGVPAVYINSTLSGQEIFDIQQRAINNEIKVLYIAPERLLLASFRTFLSKLKISLVAIDEAHCISEWGHDFRPDYRNLKILKELFSAVPTIALTATATPKVQEDILNQLEMREARVFRSSFNRPNLTYSVLQKSKNAESIFKLLDKYREDSSIIYCSSRKTTEELASILNQQKFHALPYHAGLESEVRKTTHEKFIRDEVQIIVATIAFGMGIDKPNVRLVVHYDLPKSIEGYYQETGRAGRDGLPSECVLFYSYGDKAKQEFFINQIEDDKERENAYRKLSEVINYCESTYCRKKFLLEYFGEVWNEENCKSCNNCLGEKEYFDATEISQKILSTVIRTGEIFGSKYIIDVLLGRNLRKIVDNSHNKLSVFGIVQNYSDEELKQIIQGLLQKKILGKTEGRYSSLYVTDEGRQWLSRREKISLIRPVVEFERIEQFPEYDRGLFSTLRDLRRRIAEQKNVPPFIIFGDTSLIEMSTYFPQKVESMLQISGVGERKLEEYGDKFLEVIREYCQKNGISEKTKYFPKLRNTLRKVSRTLTHISTKSLVEQGLSLEQIAKARNCKEGTIIQHIEKLVQDGDMVDIEYLKPEESVLNEIREAFQKTNDTRLAPVKEVLGDKYSYDQLRVARLFL